MQASGSRPRRSVLYIPASNERALAKAPALACDVIIFDLEDAVAPEAKPAGRQRLAALFSTGRPGAAETVIRVNAPGSAWGADDLAAAAACRPDAILLPKVESPADLLAASEALGGGAAPRLWAMIETPRAILNLGAIAEATRSGTIPLACLVAGTNDLAKDTGVSDRRYLIPWLMQIVLGARAADIDALDGVSNDFTDLEAFALECAEGAAMGFAGKTLIHPAQIQPANLAFSPSPAAIAEAREIVALFERPENAGRGALAFKGRMVERLHLVQAQRLLARADRGG